MRREGKFGLSRTLRGCCGGRAHVNPNALQSGADAQRLVQLKRCVVAWRDVAGVVPRRPAWRPWQPANCCGHSSGNTRGARLCMGHNYSHIARCSMCRCGDPTKSLKKVRGHQQRLRWKATLQAAAALEGELSSSEEVAPFIQHLEVSRRRRPTLEEFMPPLRQELVAFDVEDGPFIIVPSLCPAGCRCKPRSVRSTKASRNSRYRMFQAAAAGTAPPPPILDGWIVL